MPFPVDNIRDACAKRNTSLKQLEKDLGIGNGVIAKWENAKGSPPYDRIVAIAEHLRVPISDLTGEEKTKKAHPHFGSELIPGYSDLSEENKAKTRDFIAFLLSQQ